jgi:ribulose-5-phosphate 4-epimerase/fuculose-1-phosphate aldolase
MSSVVESLLAGQRQHSQDQTHDQIGSHGVLICHKSLDAAYGLDQQAMKAMKQWLFKQGRRTANRSPFRSTS